VYRWIEHTSELELEIEAPTEEGVFMEATAAFAELVEPDGAESAVREIRLEGGDPASLLVDWLNELVYLADVEGFVPERVRSFELDARGLSATVSGGRGEAQHPVKAVTLSGLEFGRDDAGCRARVVLDV
jgi:SHS2 domain-containing protein